MTNDGTTSDDEEDIEQHRKWLDEAAADFKLPPELIDGTPENVWGRALFRLWRHGDTTGVGKALRDHIPPPPSYCDLLASLIDPKTKDRPGALAWKKSGNFFRTMKKQFRQVDVGNAVLDAVKRGEKKYLAVENVASETGLHKRWVWAAATFAEKASRAPGREQSMSTLTIRMETIGTATWTWNQKEAEAIENFPHTRADAAAFAEDCFHGVYHATAIGVGAPSPLPETDDDQEIKIAMLWWILSIDASTPGWRPRSVGEWLQTTDLTFAWAIRDGKITYTIEETRKLHA